VCVCGGLCCVVLCGVVVCCVVWVCVCVCLCVCVCVCVCVLFSRVCGTCLYRTYSNPSCTNPPPEQLGAACGYSPPRIIG
jgi:hypothetical protein